MAQVGEKRTVEGLAVGPGRYRVTEEEIKDRFNYSWRVDPGVDLNRDSVWEMNMTVRHDQLVRFPQECMFLKFMAKSPNVDYVSDTAGDVDGKYVKLKIGFTQPMDNKPPVYFDGTLGASVFFEKIEVLVNGVPVPDTQGMSSYGFIYAAMNKIYCSEKHRKEKYLREIYRVSNDVDGHIPSEKVAKPEVEGKPGVRRGAGGTLGGHGRLHGAAPVRGPAKLHGQTEPVLHGRECPAASLPTISIRQFFSGRLAF